MPSRPLKPCARPGCAELVTSGYCSKHRTVARSRDSEKERAIHRLYDRAWKRARAAQLAKEPWCADCLRANIWEPATEVHHDERHQGDREIFWKSKRTSLCHTCHSKRTADETGINAGGRGGQNV